VFAQAAEYDIAHIFPTNLANSIMRSRTARALLQTVRAKVFLTTKLLCVGCRFNNAGSNAMYGINRMLVAAGFLGLIAFSAFAQYPTKPVRIIVPYPPGGIGDTVPRIVSQPLSQVLGQNIIIDNRPGAEGSIGGQLAAKSAADGYTLFLGAGGTMAAMPALRKNPPYDPVADFTPVSQLGKIAFYLMVHPSVPAKTLSELISHARANPGKLNYGSANAFAILATAQLMSIAKIDMAHVPYKGEAPASIDLMTGRIQLIFSTATTTVPHVKDGKLRALVTLLEARSPLLPDVPTAVEAGMPQLSIANWFALFAPAKTPKDIVERLSRDVNVVLKRQAVREQLDKLAFEPKGSTPAELAAYLKEQLEVYSSAARSAGIKPE
jgi:tripartite-type tricarboxylate transporter receptor subunit TctC